MNRLEDIWSYELFLYHGEYGRPAQVYSTGGHQLVEARQLRAENQDPSELQLSLADAPPPTFELIDDAATGSISWVRRSQNDGR